MIIELATLDVIPSQTKAFEQNFNQAQSILSSMEGYIHHELHKGIENPNRYILLVQWQTLEDHTIGFRQSKEYQQWKALLHHFYNPFPTVEHFNPTSITTKTKKHE